MCIRDSILGELQFNQNEDFSARGIFLQNELTLNEKLQLSFGLRYDEVEYSVTDSFLSDGNDSGKRKLNDASPMLGAIYDLSPTINLFGSIATSFETPSTSDFANPSGGGGFNPSLDPQNATNHEIGLRGTIDERQYFEVALFNIDIKKEIVPFDDDGRTYYQNAGSSGRSGIELSLISDISDRVRTSLSYSYGDFEFESFQTIVDEIYIVGFSTGASLTLHHVLSKKEPKNIKGLILISPGIKENTPLGLSLIHI